MSCLLRRNENGYIVEVTTPSGQKSELFDAIHSNPYMGDTETSVKILSLAYTEGIQKTFPEGSSNTYSSGEPVLKYRSKTGSIHEDIEEILSEGNSGDVTAGFVNPKTGFFIPVMKFSTNAGPNARFITDQITEGTLSSKRVLGKDGITRFQGKGEYLDTRIAMAALFNLNSKDTMARGNTVINKNDGTIEIDLSDGHTLVENSDGSFGYIADSELETKAETFVNKEELKGIARVISGASRPMRRKYAKAVAVDPKSLERSLHNFLKSLGFSETTMENYRKRYNTIYGKDPDIQAIADISNRVVAFANGQITIDRLSEEVAHIAIEAYSDQNSIMGALATAHLTPEYQEFSAYYRTKYAPYFTGVELEEQVRREIMGKILAKEFISNFQARQRDENGVSLVGKLKEYWDKFIAYIGRGLKPFHLTALNDLNKKIADSVINNNMQDFQYDLSSNNKFFYSAMSQSHQAVHQTLLRTKRVLESTLSSAGKSNADQYFLDRIQEDMTTVNLIDSVNTVVGIVDRKVSELDRELKNLKPMEVLSLTGANIANSLRESLIPNITAMQTDINNVLEDADIQDEKIKEKLKNTIEIVSKSVENLIVKNAQLQELVNKDNDAVARRDFEATYDTQNMTKEQYDKELAKFVGTASARNKDYGVFGKMFGLITESSNPVLQLIAQKVQKMNLAVRMQFTDDTKEALTEILKKGWQKFETKIIKKDENGNNTYHIWGPMDYHKYDKAFLKEKVRILAAKTNKEKGEVENLLKKYTPAEILKSEGKYDEYATELKEWVDKQKVRQFKDKYYEDKEGKFSMHSISKPTQETIKNFGARTAEIVRPFMNESGQIDKSSMSEAEVEALGRIKKEKELVKSPFDQANEVRVGLRIVKVEELTQEELDKLSYKPSAGYKGDLVVLADGYTLETLPEDSRISIDMNTLAYAYMFDDTKEGVGVSEEFKAKIKELEAKAETGEISYEDVFNWVADNSTISLSDQYYSSIDTTTSYENMVEAYISNIYDASEQRKVSNLFDEYRRLTQMRRYLMKQNKKVGSSLDVNVHSMDGKTRLKLLKLEEDISGIRKRINLPDEFKEGMERAVSFELTEDFYKMAREAGLASEGDIFKFALDHMTSANRRRTEEFGITLDDLLNGSRTSMEKYNEEFMDDLYNKGILHDGMTREQYMRVAKDEYAKKNIAGYFKKFVPSNFSSAMETLKSGQVKLSELIENPEVVSQQVPGLEFIEFNPDYTWTAAINSEDLLNPAYKKGEYHLQLNEEYLDHKWFEHYGISKEAYLKLKEDDISKLTASKNVEEFEFLKAYMSLREKSISNYGDKDRVNKWQRVQISKTMFEKMSSANSLLNLGKLTKDSWKDFTQNRVDEKLWGEELEGVSLIQEGSYSSIRAVPKYFQAKLEDPATISDSVLSSVLLDLKESIVYAERVKAERDVRALMHQITKQNFVENGASLKGRVATKPGQVSNMYSKAKEYIDHHLYGVQQSRPFFITVNGKEKDLTKIITNVQTFTRFSNLGFNFFVDLTGATTGFLNNVIDRFAGDYYHKSSVNRANSQALAMIPGLLKETASLERTSQLGQILELLGVEDPADRVRESKSGKVGRFLKGSPYFGSRLSNLAIAPKVVLATLNDHRFVDGEFISFETFVHRKMNLGETAITMKDVETAWSTLEKESLFDHLEFTPKGIKFNSKFESRFSDPKAEFDKIITSVSAKAQKVIMNSDMVLNDVDRVAAQRDVLTNTLLMHRGWMLINLTKRFKSDFYNVSTGRYEEGQYRTLINTLGGLLSVARGRASVSELRDGLERYQVKNLWRSGIEFAILGALLIMGEAVLAADDDDDTELENLFQLIYLRTTSEFNSSTAMGIPGSIVEAASSPIPALNTYKMLNIFQTAPMLFETTKAGENKLWKQVKKNSILRRYAQYSDLQAQVDAFRHFNTPTLLNLGEEKKDDQKQPEDNPLNSIRIN